MPSPPEREIGSSRTKGQGLVAFANRLFSVHTAAGRQQKYFVICLAPLKKRLHVAPCSSSKDTITSVQLDET